MRIELTEDEATTLRSLLHDYLPDLRREVAATDARDMRHELGKRQDLCESLLARLGERPDDQGWRTEGEARPL
jgi:hypothetical protein